MQQKLSSHDQAITELQRACTDHSDLLTSLDSTVSTLKAEVKLLTDKCEDLEGRARRNNIWLIGVRPTEFIAQLLMDSLGLEEFPLLDRAHRTLRSKPSDGKPPRPFVIRVHFFHVRNDILRRASEAPLLHQGKRLFLFPDYTSSVAKKRAAFTDVKRLLHSCPGVKFGLRFPATLKITLPGGATHTFEDPATAMDFVKLTPQHKIKTQWEEDLGEEISEELWDAILRRVHSSSICARQGMCLHQAILLQHPAEGHAGVVQFSVRWRIIPTDLTDLHVIRYEYERDLLPLVLSHCQYSMEQETLLEYDLPQIQQQILTGFLQGKPHITINVRHCTTDTHHL
ncbi:hypothetical protein PO909_032437 [Leuciscus waleckii]